jgi:hypothetical protein
MMGLLGEGRGGSRGVFRRFEGARLMESVVGEVSVEGVGDGC